MHNRFLRYTAFLLSLIVFFSLCLVDAGAQSRRRRRSRRPTKKVVRPVVTNPPIAPPGSEQNPGADTERIISTEEEPTPDPAATPEPVPARKKKATDADMQQTINQLSNQVDKLNDKLTQMQENDRALIDMERLTRAEQRAESLRAQQVDVESKLADLSAKLDQVDYQLRPENIEQASGYGTTHPEEAREARRRQLENEKARLQSQVKILETSKERLETSLTTADAEVDSLRRRIELQQATQDTSGADSSTRPARKVKPE
jgi:DNA repair exonuclease SbcCD ATPase subunit